MHHDRWNRIVYHPDYRSDRHLLGGNWMDRYGGGVMFLLAVFAVVVLTLILFRFAGVI